MDPPSSRVTNRLYRKFAPACADDVGARVCLSNGNEALHKRDGLEPSASVDPVSAPIDPAEDWFVNIVSAQGCANFVEKF